MIIWILLFSVVLIASFILALKSMEDYKESPQGLNEPYALYLIQNVGNLTIDVVYRIHQRSLDQGLFVSFERLFKGQKKALVVYGPVSILEQFSENLGLLELEEYSHRVNKYLAEGGGKTVSAWEMGLKKGNSLKLSSGIESLNIDLEDSEEFWWQVNLQPIKPDIFNKIADIIDQLLQGRLGILLGMDQSELGDSLFGPEVEPEFRAVIRAVLIGNSPARTQNLGDQLSQIGNQEGLTKIPQPLTSSQIVQFYQDRTFPTGKYTQINPRGAQIKIVGSEIPILVKI